MYRRKLAVLQEEIEMACAAIHVDTLVNVAQAVVRRNQKCLDTDEVKCDLYSSLVIGIY